MVSLFAAGCAVDQAGDVGATSEDALGTLATSEVVGSITLDWYAGEAEAPTADDEVQYRAFQFEAYAGQKLAAYVVTNNDADPVAYILDSSFRMLKRNDDRASGVTDAAIAFTPPASGTYYLAFKTKERKPATVMARVVDDEVGGLRTKSFADGWPVRQRRSGESEYAYERGKHEVTISALVKAGAISISNASECPADPFQPGAGLSVPDGLNFKVDPVARTVIYDGGTIGGRADIDADGSFEMDSGLDRWGFVRASGRLAAGGFLIVDHVEKMACTTNSMGDRVHDALRMNTAIGAADPNYR
jgi:hypothetical protein